MFTCNKRDAAEVNQMTPLILRYATFTWSWKYNLIHSRWYLLFNSRRVTCDYNQTTNNLFDQNDDDFVVLGIIMRHIFVSIFQWCRLPPWSTSDHHSVDITVKPRPVSENAYFIKFSSHGSLKFQCETQRHIYGKAVGDPSAPRVPVVITSPKKNSLILPRQSITHGKECSGSVMFQLPCQNWHCGRWPCPP